MNFFSHIFSLSILRLGLVFLMCAGLFTSCGCPDFVTEPTSNPVVREATITQFNSTWNTATNLPDPRYSIHTFEFPSNLNSSGSLPNDARFGNGRTLILGDTTYTDVTTGQTRRAEAVLQTPTNETLTGDWVLVDGNFTDPITGNRFAILRVYGSVAQFPGVLLASASARDFAVAVQTLANDKPRYENTQKNAIQFGCTPATSRPDYMLKVYDQSGLISPTPSVPPAVTAKFDALGTAIVCEIRVQIGQVYYYKARNGVEFAVLIEDIRQGSLTPNLNRMTIKFAEVFGFQQCSAN